MLTKPTRFQSYLMKSSLPYYAFVVISCAHLFINLKLKLPAIVIFNFFALFPYLDDVISRDWTNPDLKQTKQLENSVYFLIPLYLGLLMDWLITFRMLYNFWNMTMFNQALSLFLISLLFSTTFLIAHQLMHHNSKFSRFIATLHQIKCMYMHFTIYHLNGHHKDVATPLDPASAEKGMSLYQFLPKCIIGSYKYALKISPRTVSFFTLCYGLYLGMIYFIFDFSRVVIALIAALGGVIFLEAINYIQHYGLRRKQLPDGTFEKVNIRHSWNAPHRLSNYLLFKLQRHSDHHQNGSKPYQTLCSYEQSPQLPQGYLTCLILCFFPSKWFQIMDPLVDQYMNSESAMIGTQLKSMPESLRKIRQFNMRNMKILGVLVAVNVILRFKFLIMS